jgi:hypothetical protein
MHPDSDIKTTNRDVRQDERQIQVVPLNGGHFDTSKKKLYSFITFILTESVYRCPTSGVAQRAMREAAPHARGVNKARPL